MRIGSASFTESARSTGTISADTLGVTNIDDIDWLKNHLPYQNNKWHKDFLYEYLIASCYTNTKDFVTEYLENYLNDEALADMLFSFLLDDAYDGSDSQMGAAQFLGKFDRNVLKKKKALLLKAQENEVFWKRPFDENQDLSWL